MIFIIIIYITQSGVTWTEGLSSYISLTDCRELMAPTRRAPLRGGRSWRRAAPSESLLNNDLIV